MPISLECPSCLHPFSVAEEQAGRKTKCPACQFGLFVPRSATNTEPAIEAVAAAPVAGAATRVNTVTKPAIRKKQAVVAATPAKDNPFEFNGEKATSEPPQPRGRSWVKIVVVLLLFLGLTVFVQVGGAAVTMLYFWTQAARQDAAHAEAEAVKAKEVKRQQDLPPEPVKVVEDPQPPKRIAPKKDGPKQVSVKPGLEQPNPKPKGRIVVSFARLPASVKPGDQVPFSIDVVREDCVGDVRLQVTQLSSELQLPELPILPDDIDRLNTSVTVGEMTKPGTYSITVTASLGKVMDVKTFELKVEKVAVAAKSPAPPEAPPPVPAKKGKLLLTPIQAQIVKAGESTTIGIRVVRQDCKGDVELTVVGGPPGIKVEDKIALPADSDHLDISVPVAANTRPNRYELRVTAKLNGLSDSKIFYVLVDKPAPPENPKP